jgi:hypothetical protein
VTNRADRCAPIPTRTDRWPAGIAASTPGRKPSGIFEESAILHVTADSRSRSVKTSWRSAALPQQSQKNADNRFFAAREESFISAETCENPQKESGV